MKPSELYGPDLQWLHDAIRDGSEIDVRDGGGAVPWHREVPTGFVVHSNGKLEVITNEYLDCFVTIEDWADRRCDDNLHFFAFFRQCPKRVRYYKSAGYMIDDARKRGWLFPEAYRGFPLRPRGDKGPMMQMSWFFQYEDHRYDDVVDWVPDNWLEEQEG